ncbi:glycogen synthase GlgA [Burkholderia cepacia]|uniref:glycogen synthase GlgA n=1 Tax=Burkholderia cepacia TaxID=292 RepID=UPI00249DA92E|nr:glycogen synthase GlgA [Burkholderia cepacia]WGY73534.1 glycogen synthase GlgA [Burkholderia cepacia]
MRVLHVCTEIYPLLKTGGLADVTGALPAAQARLGCDARVVVPGFPALRAGVIDPQLVAELGPCFGARDVRLYRGELPDSGVTAYVIDAPDLYARPGNPYADAQDHAYPDNHRRFALLGWAAARIAQGLDPQWHPQVVHCHDWHAGLAPAYLKAAEAAERRKLPGSVLTVHNLAYQGVFDEYVFNELGLPRHFFGMDGMEFHGKVSFLKAGLFFADQLTTVSPTYAREIQDSRQGCGLDGLLRSRARDLTGILNGIDDAVWNPAADPAIAACYDVEKLTGKSRCKSALRKELDLAPDTAPLFGVVSRITEQKGLHLILAALPDLVRRGGQFVLLGTGDLELEMAFKRAAAAYPGAVAVVIGYDEQMSHRIIAGSDVIMVPSRFEPCGLTQLYGLRYGTLPLVRRIGGLADTVVDASLENLADETANGFVFDAFDVEDLSAAVRRAFALYARPAAWKKVQRHGMRLHFGWHDAAGQFLEIYRSIAA